MSKNIRKHQVLSLFFFSMFFYIDLKPNSVMLSFDTLFPKSWYEKSLETSLYVWQILENTSIVSVQDVLMVGDTVLARLTFAQYCSDQMKEERNRIITEDKEYFLFVLHNIQKLLKNIQSIPQAQDFVTCSLDIVNTIITHCR